MSELWPEVRMLSISASAAIAPTVTAAAGTAWLPLVVHGEVDDDPGLAEDALGTSGLAEVAAVCAAAIVVVGRSVEIDGGVVTPLPRRKKEDAVRSLLGTNS